MMKNALRVAAAAIALTFIAAACGSDNPTASTTVTMASPIAAADDATATTMGAMNDATHDDAAAHDEMDGMDTGHTHETAPWPDTLDVPELTLTATPHDDGTADLKVGITGFKLQSGEGATGEAGSGHLHLIVDGHDAGMAFTPEIHLDGLLPGPHDVAIRLSGPDHLIYAYLGTPLTYEAEFVIPGDVPVPDQVIDISVDASGVVGGIADASVNLGDLVNVNISSTVSEEVHLHVYDITADLNPGETATLTFTADIPGVFEAELEGPGIQILNLEVK